MTTPDKDYLTTQEAADYLGVKPQYIHRLFNEGKLTGWRGQGPNGRLHISSVSIKKFTVEAAQ
jgi:excisionase family DNA binding protein